MAAFDDGVYDARHFRGYCTERFAIEIGIAPILGNVALELVPKAVLLLSDRYLSSQPHCSTQSRVAELRQPGLATVLARLIGRQVEAAKLQKLPVMTEAA